MFSYISYQNRKGADLLLFMQTIILISQYIFKKKGIVHRMLFKSSYAGSSIVQSCNNL